MCKTFILADLGEKIDEVEFIPMPETAPQEVPAPAPVEAPSEPAPEKVPA